MGMDMSQGPPIHQSEARIGYKITLGACEICGQLLDVNLWSRRVLLEASKLHIHGIVPRPPPVT